MASTQPPPYSRSQPVYSGQQATAAKPLVENRKAVYWSYWGALFATPLTWVFAVAAAADDAWLKTKEGGVAWQSFEEECLGGELDDYDEGEKVCRLFTAGKAFQYMATIIVSFILVAVVVAAFMAAPTTGKLGLAAGIALVVFSVFQLIAFALMAAFAEELQNFTLTSSSYTFEIDLGFEAGPALGVSIVAWLLGTAGAVAVLALRARVAADHDGPFRTCMSNVISGANMGTPAGPRAPAFATAPPAGQPQVPVVAAATPASEPQLPVVGKV